MIKNIRLLFDQTLGAERRSQMPCTNGSRSFCTSWGISLEAKLDDVDNPNSHCPDVSSYWVQPFFLITFHSSSTSGLEDFVPDFMGLIHGRTRCSFDIEFQQGLMSGLHRNISTFDFWAWQHVASWQVTRTPFIPSCTGCSAILKL